MGYNGKDEQMSWTAGKTVRLKHLWKAGYTAAEIGEKLNYSRNAVIGRAHRLNLDARRSGRSSKGTKHSIKTIGRKEQARMLLLDNNFEPEIPTQLEELTEHHCRWPEGEPGKKDFYFCGRTPVKGFSYCRLHVLIGFRSRNEHDTAIIKEDARQKKIRGLLPTTP